jgi:WD40 repeat protein
LHRSVARRLRPWAPILAATVLFAGSLAPAADPTPAEIHRLIDKLGSPKFADREAASQALTAVGELALEALRKAANNPDPEIRVRVAALISAIERQYGEVLCFEGHDKEVGKVVFMPGGRRALSGSGHYGDEAILWDVESCNERTRFRGYHGSIQQLALAPDGRQFASAGIKEVLLWDVATGKVVRHLEGLADGVSNLAYSPDGHRLLTGGGAGALRVWDVATGKELRQLRPPATDSIGSGAVNGLTFSPDGRLALAGGYDRRVQLWDVETGREVRSWQVPTLKTTGPMPFFGVAFAPDGSRALACTIDAVYQWEVQSGQELSHLFGPTGTVIAAAYSPDGRRVIAGDQYGTIHYWDAAGGQELACYKGHAGMIRSVAFAPDGRRALSSGDDKTVRLWGLPK